AKAEQRQITELTIAAGPGKEDELVTLAKRHKGSGLGEQALYNALLVAREGGDIGKFYQLGEEFVVEYPRSSHRSDVVTALGNVAMDRADFRQAAQYFEAAYASDPNGKESVSRLLAASTVRAFLADPKVGGDLRQLAARSGQKIDDLLWVVAQSGNFAALE